MVWEKISFAESNGADVLLFAVTSSLSPQAIDEINKWNIRNKHLTIRFWNGFDITNKLKSHPLISIKFGLASDPRKELGSALLPSTSLLLKYSISAHSAEVFNTPSASKHEVLYALAELISARVSEFESKGQFSIASFRNSHDGFDWLETPEALESSGADRYAIRAIATYIKDFLKAEKIKITYNKPNIHIALSKELPSNVLCDLQQIALLSNLEITQPNNQLTIRVRQHE